MSRHGHNGKLWLLYYENTKLRREKKRFYSTNIVNILCTFTKVARSLCYVNIAINALIYSPYYVIKLLCKPAILICYLLCKPAILICYLLYKPAILIC